MEQFENIVVRVKSDGTVVRLKDVARVELGAEDYSWSTSLNNKPTAAIAIYQLPDANSIQIAKVVRLAMDDQAKHFPEDLEWSVPYDMTRLGNQRYPDKKKTFSHPICFFPMHHNLKIREQAREYT